MAIQAYLTEAGDVVSGSIIKVQTMNAAAGLADCVMGTFILNSAEDGTDHIVTQRINDDITLEKNQVMEGPFICLKTVTADLLVYVDGPLGKGTSISDVSD